MKTLLLIAFALAGIVPASVRAQAFGSDTRLLEGCSGRASLLDVTSAAAPTCRARTLDLRALALILNELPVGAWDSLFIPPGGYNYDAGGPFFEPTVINGRVYVGSDTQVTVFGL